MNCDDCDSMDDNIAEDEFVHDIDIDVPNLQKVFKLTNGQMCDFVKEEVVNGVTHYLLSRPKKGPYQPVPLAQQKQRGRPAGAKNRNPTAKKPKNNQFVIKQLTVDEVRELDEFLTLKGFK